MTPRTLHAVCGALGAAAAYAALEASVSGFGTSDWQWWFDYGPLAWPLRFPGNFGAAGEPTLGRAAIAFASALAALCIIHRGRPQPSPLRGLVVSLTVAASASAGTWLAHPEEVVVAAVLVAAACSGPSWWMPAAFKLSLLPFVTSRRAAAALLVAVGYVVTNLVWHYHMDQVMGTAYKPACDSAVALWCWPVDRERMLVTRAAGYAAWCVTGWALLRGSQRPAGIAQVLVVALTRLLFEPVVFGYFLVMPAVLAASLVLPLPVADHRADEQA